MKKVVGILFLIFVLFATTSLAAYPAELEEAETQAIEEGSLTEENLEEDEPLVEFRTNEAETTVISDDIYEMQEDVTITGVIDANVYVLAKNAKFEKAIVYGNVYVMAENLEFVDSDIGGSTYVIANDMKFSGSTNDLYAIGENLEFDLDAYVWRGAKIIANTLNFNGQIERDLYAVVEQQLTIEDNAVIHGELNYTASEQGSISTQAQIQDIQFTQKEVKEEKQGLDAWDIVYEILTVVLKTLLVALIIVFCVNRFKTVKRSDKVAMDFLKDAGKGFLYLVFVPLIFMLLLCSIIGIGIGFVVLAIYLISLYVATSVISVEIAYRILAKKQPESMKKGQFIGLSIFISLLIWVIKFIPVVGNIIRFVLILMGLGVFGSTMFQKKEEVVNER